MMRKRVQVTHTVTVDDDILDRLRDLYKQATVERSHFYVGCCVKDAMAEIERLRRACGEA
jgi:cytidine deaminase